MYRLLQTITAIFVYGVYAPINGLPQDGGGGIPREFDFVKLYSGRDFDIHNGHLARWKI